jgi:acyl-coenzyme A thioesterase PaaI-like protein
MSDRFGDRLDINLLAQIRSFHDGARTLERRTIGGIPARHTAFSQGAMAWTSNPFRIWSTGIASGCGRLNEHGFQIKSQWGGDAIVCRWQPQPFHVGLPGRLQGGVIATAIICHSLWAATATACRDDGIAIEEPMPFAYSTTSLTLDFLEPIPIDTLVTLRAHVTAIDGEHATVSCEVFVNERETTRAQSEHRRIALPQ